MTERIECVTNLTLVVECFERLLDCQGCLVERGEFHYLSLPHPKVECNRVLLLIVAGVTLHAFCAFCATWERCSILVRVCCD